MKKQKVVVSTSREPSPKTRSFLKDLTSLVPWVVRVNRGKLTFYELIEEALMEGSNTLALIGEMRGNPSILRLYDLTEFTNSSKVLHTYTIMLKGVTLSREAGHKGVNLGEVADIVIEPIVKADEEEKSLILALHQLFNSGIVPVEGKKHIRIIINPTFKLIKFKLMPINYEVGPIIRYSKVNMPKRIMELGEEVESE